jgi:tetratricopeptide (TPR) repeat protein/SAM-dependent methyltransferase
MDKHLELIQKGMKLHQDGQLQEAAAIYRRVLQINPDHADANHLLGVLVSRLGSPLEAVDLISKAIGIAPKQPIYHNNLGNVLRDLGRSDAALASYGRALALKPDYAGAHYNLGKVLRELGRLDDALACYTKALAIQPDNPGLHNNLGNLLRDLGRSDDALASYQRALAIQPDFAEAHGNLGAVFQDLGRSADALACYQNAIVIKPENNGYWAEMVECLKDFTFTSVDDATLDKLTQLLERSTVHPHALARPVVGALRHHPEVSRLLQLTGSDDLEAQIVYVDAAERLGGIALLLRIMELSPLNDLETEGMLTCLRRALIRDTLAGTRDDKDLPFSVAMALHCFTNEYVFSETAEETVAVERLQQEIAERVENGLDLPPALLTALGAYRPLHRFPWASALLERQWMGAIEKVILRQIAEPLAERSLGPQIPRLTTIEDKVSQAVREQYEESPYPRWTKIGMAIKAETIGEFVRRSSFHDQLQDFDLPERPEILVAGCGTGRHALQTASQFANARVLAVDLSLSSLAYGKRKTQELGVTNIDFAQADIMELGSLGRSFDLIESVGVLHHLHDPEAGWRVLADLLRPGGLMKIGLYSEAARQDVVAARALIAEMGYSASAADIRRCREHIISMTEDCDSDLAKVRARQSFFSLSECRDLLFHVQEHRFTLPRIEAALEALELKFLGFEFEDRKALTAFRQSHPEKDAITSLALWHRFELENPDSFRGMYQFWCCDTNMDAP